LAYGINVPLEKVKESIEQTDDGYGGTFSLICGTKQQICSQLFKLLQMDMSFEPPPQYCSEKIWTAKPCFKKQIIGRNWYLDYATSMEKFGDIKTSFI